MAPGHCWHRSPWLSLSDLKGPSWPTDSDGQPRPLGSFGSRQRACRVAHSSHAAWPLPTSQVWGMRAACFGFYLACLLPERDEYQLLRFIQALKGTQVAQRVLLALPWPAMAFHGLL